MKRVEYGYFSHLYRTLAIFVSLPLAFNCVLPYRPSILLSNFLSQSRPLLSLSFLWFILYLSLFVTFSPPLKLNLSHYLYLPFAFALLRLALAHFLLTIALAWVAMQIYQIYWISHICVVASVRILAFNSSDLMKFLPWNRNIELKNK